MCDEKQQRREVMILQYTTDQYCAAVKNNWEKNSFSLFCETFFFFFCQYWATCNSRRHRDALCPFLGTKWKKTKKQISENKREQENRRLNDGRGGFMFRSNRRTNSTESVWNILFFTTSDHVGSGGLLFHTSHCFLWPRVNDRVVNEKYSKTHSMFLCKKKKYRCWQLINPRSFLITQTKPLKWLHYWWT